MSLNGFISVDGIANKWQVTRTNWVEGVSVSLTTSQLLKRVK